MDTFATLSITVVMAMAAPPTRAALPLPAYNIDKSQITVSGLSSGGFMANQLGYAYASTFRGVGVFAGGPYMCAGHSHYTACMYNASIGAAALNTMQADLNNWSGTANDPKAGVGLQKVFLFVGTSDTTVGPNPMNAVQAQYANNGVPAANLHYVQRAGTAHVFPTDFDASGNNACNSSASPYISNCGYDGAKALFTQFYGALNPRNNSPASGNYIEFNQATYINSNPGMAATGWVYVPADCASGAQCKLHVALHGCQQGHATIGDKFVKNTGYTRWADTNQIVVLFPQAKVDSSSRSTAASGMLPNPNGCWDWIGWYGGNFAQKAGTQMAAIKAMVDRIASGSTTEPPAPPPPPPPAPPPPPCAAAAGPSDLHHRIELRPHHRRPCVPDRRLHLRQRLQPEHGAVERLRHHHAEADGAQLLRDRNVPLTGP
jgi:poly(3-hydroxybutyrate) depolymerase